MAVPSLATFYLGLVLIVLGTGLLKPNVSAMVGDLYPEGGARRDAGFSIFYMGINIGAFAAPLIVGFLGEKISWHVGFGTAGVGMVLGLIQYVLGGRHLGDAGRYTGSETLRAQSQRQLSMALMGMVALVALLFGLSRAGMITLTATGMASAAGLLISAIAVAYFLFVISMGGLDSTEKKRITVIFILFIFSAVFWSGFEQAGSSLNLVAAQLTNRNVFGWEAPASWLQAVNPLFIISFAPVFAWLWVSLGRREPSSPMKFALGLILLGSGFFVMVAATSLAAGGRQISPMWLVLTYFLHTTGELCLSPVGLSTVTKLAPQRYVGQMMGIWFMSISLGNLMAGRVAGLFETLPLPQLFGAVTATTAGAGIILLLLVRPIRKLMVGVH